ncbi:restriction endonuclease subunit S [Cronobacter sakazakii]|uniref:restriction endonuclease subunit S n=1 Tax=Cronobacter sakazakii TaxID=28141 RepID=UPI000BE9BAAE|nr:restriction endonuclease subunit S [Cronobacter sakazakii]MBF4935380.1 restriction endonuclease subunit S [Cronobacter sakazakii]MBK4111747.1 restriction endonuclease subunit S [Cronobacter sakazakii]MDI7680286.1 restriction endonuclease subunit S [Cronobacter sakazakii]MDK1240191.1 restriction endonuclease subunit S [Cronobacter sakazakii]MDT3620155.1 restriction endonuclease subunit S [Cronobacter sakazakii]
MSANWPLVRLGDYCLKVGSGATPKGGKSVYLDAGQIALIRSQNVYNDTFKPDGLAYITVDAANKLKNVEVQSGDILLNITGDSVARLCLAPDEYLPARVNQHVAIIRPDPNEFDSRFLRYFLVSPEQQELLLVIASAGATRNALTKSHIESLEVCKPELAIQIWIANQLESLDKKIQLNHQINQTLEQMAQALFKSWFVDFEPVKAKMAVLEAGGSQEDATVAAMTAISGKNTDALAVFEREQPAQYAELKATAELFPSAMQESELGEIPEGWHVSDLSKLAILNAESWSKKNAPESVSYVDLANAKWGIINSIETYQFSDAPSRARRILKLHDTIVGTVRPGNGSYSYIYKNGLTGSTGFAVLTPKSKIFSEYIYLCVTSIENIERLTHLADGGAYPAVNADVVLSTQCVLPLGEKNLESLLEMFSARTEVFFSYRKNSLDQNEVLTSIRDTLLPKLLSGEITLPEAEQAVSEAENV